MRSAARLFALALAAAVVAMVPLRTVAAASDEPAEEAPEDLPAGEGRDETFYACVACHGLAIIKAQGMTRARWAESLDWMVQRHNMNPLENEDRERVLDYLAASFPPRVRARPNPFLNR